MTGFMAARQILDAAGLQQVEIEPVPGQLSDHYDPHSKILRLSQQVYFAPTVAAAGIAAHEAGLLDHALRRLSAINNLRIIGQARHRGAIISFNMNGAHAHHIATVIDRAGVAFRAGTHCTMPLLARFGTTATCRASFAMYNTHEEVERLGEALESAGRLFI